jgi:hypothetical protein
VSGSLAAALTGAAQDARNSARRAMRQGLALSLGCLIGAVGLGFLTAAAFLALETELGAATAALVVGLAFLIMAVGVLALAQRRPLGLPPTGATPPRPAAEAPPPPNPAALVAFTAAFVLARYLTDRPRR